MLRDALLDREGAVFTGVQESAAGLSAARREAVEIPLQHMGTLDAWMAVPPAPRAVLLVAHGIGPARGSPGSAALGHALERRGFAVVAPELLTAAEAEVNSESGRYARDLGLLVERAGTAARWIAAAPAISTLPLACVGVGAGAAVVLALAAATPGRVRAVVSCGGRVDLVAAGALGRVDAPVLLVAATAEGGLRGREKDDRVLAMNRSALDRLPCARLVVLRGGDGWERDASGCAAVAALAAEWLQRHTAAVP